MTRIACVPAKKPDGRFLSRESCTWIVTISNISLKIRCSLETPKEPNGAIKFLRDVVGICL